MKHKNKWLALLLSSSLLLSLAACDNSTTDTDSSTNNAQSSNDTGSSSENDTNTTLSAQAITEFDLENMTDVILETAGLPSNTVIATAGEFELTAGEVLAMTLNDLDYYAEMEAYGMMSTPWGEDSGTGELFEEYIMRTATELASIYKIVVKVAESEGLTMSEDMKTEILAYLEMVRVQLGDDDLAYQYVLWQAATTEELYMTNSESNELYGMLYELYFGENGTKVPASEDMVAELEALGTYRVRHILINTMGESTYDANALAEIEEIRNNLLLKSSDLEENFYEAMLEHSQDPGSSAYPEGYTAGPGEMVPEFEAASLALAVGEMSEIVESDYGYHIIYRLPLDQETLDMDTVLNSLAIEMQNQWMEEYPVVTNDLFDQLDLKLFYENLGVLRDQTQVYIAEIAMQNVDITE